MTDTTTELQAPSERDQELYEQLSACLAREPFEADARLLTESVHYLIDRWIELSIEFALLQRRLAELKRAPAKRKPTRRKRE